MNTPKSFKFFSLMDSSLNATIHNFNNSINHNQELLINAVNNFIFIRDSVTAQYPNINALNLLREQIVLYNSIVEDLHATKKTLINNSFDIKRHYTPIKKACVLFCNNDLNEYITIDKRQTLEKNNIMLFVKKLWINGTISKTEYRNFTRRNIQSENIRQHIHAYITHALLKLRHKRAYAYLSQSFKGFKNYAYIDNQNIRLNDVSKDLKTEFILYEIDKKRTQENNLFSYEKLTY